jgi:hypothetical protein
VRVLRFNPMRRFAHVGVAWVALFALASLASCVAYDRPVYYAQPTMAGPSYAYSPQYVPGTTYYAGGYYGGVYYREGYYPPNAPFLSVQAAPPQYVAPPAYATPGYPGGYARPAYVQPVYGQPAYGRPPYVQPGQPVPYVRPRPGTVGPAPVIVH